MKRPTRAEREAAVEALHAMADAATKRTLARTFATLSARLDAHARALTAAGLDDLDGLPEAWVIAAEIELMPMLSASFDLGALATSQQLASAIRARLAAGLGGVNVSAQAERWLAVARDRMFKLGDDVWGIARRSMLDGFSRGESIDQMAARLTAATDLALPAARSVTRTYAVEAANVGGLAEARALGAFAPWGRRWLCVDAATRIAGDVRFAARRWEPGPLLRLRTTGPARMLSGPGPADRDLTVTPDHLCLTTRGWVPAQALQVGDHLVGGSLAERAAVGQPDIERRPPTIAEVFDAAALARPAERVVSVVPDLDGEAGQREVNVVAVDGELRRRVLAPLQQPGTQSLLALSDVDLEALLRCGSTSQRLASHLAAPSLLRPPPHIRQGGLAVMAPAVAAGSGAVAQLGSGSPQHSDDGGSRASLRRGQGTDGLARCVSLHEVVGVESIQGGRHVYDVETGGGWFMADGIIVHNSTNDSRTRPWHSEAHGQIVALDEPFIVGGEQLDHPGDGSPENSANCRCTEIWIEENPEGKDVGELEHKQMKLGGEEGLSAAAGEVQTGAMVALVPSEADAQRLAVDGFELPEELHATLAFLGDADGWSAEPRQAVEEIAAALARRPPIVCDLHGLGIFNAADNPCALYLLGDTDLAYDPPLTPALAETHAALWRELDDYGSEGIPDQHSPFVAHLAIGYGADLALLEHAGETITLDRLRVAWADDHVDFPFAEGDSAAAAEPAPTVAPDEEAEMTAGNLLLTYANIRNEGGGGLAIFDRGVAAAERAEQLMGPLAPARIGAALNDPLRGVSGLRSVGMWFTDQARAQIARHVSRGELAAAQQIVLKGVEISLGYQAGMPPSVVAAIVDPMARPEEFHAWLGFEEEATLEKPSRLFSAGSLVWREPPFPLMWMEVDSHGGMPVCPTYQVGLITRVERNGNAIEAWGVWDDDPGNDKAVEARRRVDEGILRWGSMDMGDIGDVDVELVFPEGVENPDELPPDEVDEMPMDELFVEPEQVIFHHARIGMWTLVPNPAFEEAFIEPLEQAEAPAATPPPEAAGRAAVVVTSNASATTATQPMAQPSADGATTELEAAVVAFAAAPPHHTTTSDVEWDPAAAAAALAERVPLPIEDAYAAFAWLDVSQADEEGLIALANCQLLHHEVDADGMPQAANLAACNATIDAVNADGAGVPDADRQAVYDHLAAHVVDAGLAPAELAPAGEEEQPEEAAALTAAAYRIELPNLPALSWFSKPPREVVRRGALTITDEGRVYGLLAPGGTPHVGRMDRKTVPLRNVDYRRFLRGETPVLLADGSVGRVVTGNLTMACGHASTQMPNGATIDQYDNSCSLFATAVCGEADGDVWIAGALLHGVEPDQVRRAMACQLSGHWNPHELAHGRYELLGALLVPHPGFPFGRQAPTAPTTRWQDDGEELRLVASAVPVRFERTRPERQPLGLGPVAQRIARDLGRDYSSRAQRAAARVRR